MDETFEPQYWSGGSALGKRINVGGPNSPWATIVGVAARVRRDGPRHAGEPQVYVPYPQSRVGMMHVVIRTAAPPSAAAGAFQRAAADLDPELPVAQVVRIEELAERSIAADRFNLLLVLSFACCALLLAGVGLYGVVSYLVSHSRRESASVSRSGAPPAPSSVAWCGAAASATCGIALGAPATLAIGQLVASLLFEVDAADPSTLAVAAAATSLIALLAAYAPARRITAMDPATAIRS